MLPTTIPAKYLLRFDDLCPTMDWNYWSEIEAALVERNLKPLLAVVPDNQDPALKLQPAAEDFWDRVRGWQGRGWTIALHGYQHRYVTHHAGIVTVKKQSEFAGVPRAEQEDKLRRGVEIFARHGIQARVWIAPSNSFDATTVSILAELGIAVISDGYFRFPFVGRYGMLWVPQQLFGFRPAPPGVWTVCYHHNKWTPADAIRFRVELDAYGGAITSLEEVERAWGRRYSCWSNFLCTSPRLSPLLVRCQLRAWSWRENLKAKSPPAFKPLPHLEAR